MNNTIVIIGVGELGGVFARAFLRAGYPVHPVNRHTDQPQVSELVPAPQLVLICVGERDLQAVMQHLPTAWRDRVGLVQNELLPRDWRPHLLVNPTVASIWFEKKKGREVNVVLPSPIFGPDAGLLQQVLAAMDIPSVKVEDEQQMLFELVRKNLYILVTNICGLKTGGTVGELWSRHEQLARQVAAEVLDIQQALTQGDLDRTRLITAMLVAFNSDPEHGCLGRSAKERLRRAVEHGDAYRLELPTLRQFLREV